MSDDIFKEGDVAKVLLAAFVTVIFGYLILVASGLITPFWE